jgi:hypothetical protein
MTEPRVRFREEPGELLRVIEIDAPLSSGGPDLLFRTLSALGTQILLAQVRVAGDRLVQRLHVCEADGAALDLARQNEIRVTVERALTWRGPRRALPRAEA